MGTFRGDNIEITSRSRYYLSQLMSESEHVTVHVACTKSKLALYLRGVNTLRETDGVKSFSP
eukprot:484936-Prymnesium_polylepis.2